MRFRVVVWSLMLFSSVARGQQSGAGARDTTGRVATPLLPQPALDLLTQRGLAGILETFGGGAILIGLFTRPIAFLLSGEMAVAYFQVHFPRAFLPIRNGGDNVVLFCFVFLYLAFAGSGPWSADQILRSRRSTLQVSGD